MNLHATNTLAIRTTSEAIKQERAVSPNPTSEKGKVTEGQMNLKRQDCSNGGSQRREGKFVHSIRVQVCFLLRFFLPSCQQPEKVLS